MAQVQKSLFKKYPRFDLDPGEIFSEIFFSSSW